MAIYSRRTEVKAVATKVENPGSTANSVGVLADSANGETVFIGGKDVNKTDKGFPLAPGDFFTLDLRDISTMWAIGKEGDKLYMILEGV